MLLRAAAAHQQEQLFPCDWRYELQARLSTANRIVATTARQPGMFPRPAQTLPMHCSNATSQLVLPAFAAEAADGVRTRNRCLCVWDQRCSGGITGVARVVANVVFVAALGHVVPAATNIKSDPQGCWAAAASASAARGMPSIRLNGYVPCAVCNVPSCTGSPPGYPAALH